LSASPALLSPQRSVPAVAAATTVLVGCMVLLGWALDVVYLKSVLPGLHTMKVNAALAFLLAGIALWLWRTETAGLRARRLARACGLGVVLIGALTLGEDALRRDFRIDQLLFVEPPGTPETSHPGRMAPLTALAFLLLGVALLVPDAPPRFGVEPAQALAVAVAVFALLNLVAYLYGVEHSGGVVPYTRMALHTAATFLLLAVGLLYARPLHGLMRIATSRSLGGLTLRRLIVVAPAATLLIGWACVAGLRAGLYDAPFALALFQASSALVFAVMIWLNARSLHNADAKRVEAEGALREREARFSGLLEASPDAIIMVNCEGRIVIVNAQTEALFGCTRAELLDQPIETLLPERSRDRHLGHRAGYFADPQRRLMGAALDLYGRRKDGTEFPVDISLSPFMTAEGPFTISTIRDITERKHLDEQLRLWQKLEGVGRLASGIAHDFNNLLTVIMGRATLMLGSLKPEDPLRREVSLILKTGERAAALTRQLLAFSRKQLLQPTVMDLNAVLAGLAPMLRRLVSEDIELVMAAGLDLGRIKVDESQLEQVIVNLVVNARDAMPGGGRLTLETANVELSDDYARRHVSVQPGPYVMLAVGDTGVGMDAETQAHLFEPFFTTKEPGKGTGLGLATVYGIVKQSGGNVWVYSEAGHGSCFKIYLPQVEEAADPREPGKALPVPLNGSETILLVEDEAEVRVLVRNILETLGYTVLEAQHPGEVSVIVERHAGPIHLLLTDMIMPRMSGRALAEQLEPLRPEMKVLYISGYTDNTILHHGLIEPGIAFLQKPFVPDALARKVRAVLDTGGSR